MNLAYKKKEARISCHAVDEEPAESEGWLAPLLAKLGTEMGKNIFSEAGNT